MKRAICFLFAILFLQNSAFAADIFKFERLFPALQQPWYFDKPNGVAVDEYGFVYLADTDNNRIQKYSTDGQFIAQWEGFYQPHGIVTDKMGFVYVTDSWNHRIRKFTNDGNFVSEWNTGGFSTGITIDRKNFIYTVNTDDLCVYKYTSEGSFIKKWQMFNEQVTEDIRLLIGIASDDKDFIYVSDIQNHLIRKFTADGDFITQWGGKGNTPGQLNLPTGLAADRDGYVYVCDANNDRVQKFDPNGKLITTWGGKEDVIGRFYTPIGIAVSKSGTVYVTDWDNHSVQVFDANGKFLNNWQSYGSEAGKFDRPEAVASDHSGNIYVVDKNNNRIQKFNPEGKFISEWNGENTPEGKLKTPFGIAVFGEDVYVADTDNHRIRRFGLNGEAKTGWGSLGSADGQFNLPLGVAVNKESDDKMYVYVTDWKNYRIQKFDADGNFICKWGERGNGNVKFEKPHGIVVYDGFVYVSDESYYSRILKFDINGNYIRQWGSFGTDNGKFKSPTNLAIFENYLYIADTDNHRIQKYTLDGNFAESIGTNGTAPGYFNSPVGLCFGTQGRLYVSESANHRIQVFNRNTTQKISKAIIVAGKRENDPLWDHTRLCANFAYRTFTHQGIGKENIRYLTSDTQSDLDFDGNPDTVFSPTNAEFKSAIEWAKDADQLVIYLVDHGGTNDSSNGIFRLSSSETFDMSELNPLLDNLQQEKIEDIIAVFDTCKSGLFLKPSQIPTGKKRILISSTKTGEEAHFVAQGTGSFSYQFWSNIFNGKDVKTAFGNAAKSLGLLGDLQHPQADANGDGLDDGNSDTLAGVYIGSGSAISGENPLISEISQPQSINGSNTAKITAAVTDNDGVARVWAMIRPPGYTNETQKIAKDKPILELPFIELRSLGNNRYEGSYDGFTVSGTYSLAVFAQDKRGNTSLPGITSVSVGSPVRRCAILVNGVSDTSRTIFEKNISDTNNALKFQGYKDEDIRILSSTALPNTVKNLQESIETWASVNTSELVLYMTGRGSPGYFHLNLTENLSVSELDQWLDKLQSQTNIRIILIFDSDYSGGFLPLLMPDSGKTRIIIASASEDQPAAFPEGDQLSFSVFFWDSILNGESVGKSFFKAKEAIAFFAQRTEQYAPRMDDNGNGIGNERADGIIAIDHILGAGIRLASDSSNILQYQKTDKGVYLYVSNLSITGAVSKVWADITPPAKDAFLYTDAANQVQAIAMEYNSQTQRYEGLCSLFPVAGYYAVTVYALNSDGIRSTVSSFSIPISDGKDIYEYDDSVFYANTIIINDHKQYHNFHNAQDTDWLKFYAVSGQTYSIKAEYPGTGGTMRLELHNPQNILVDFRETSDAQKEIQWDWIAPATGNGIYYLKIIPKDFNFDSLYTIQIYRPVGPFVGYINGTITDAATGALISEAALVTDADASAISRPNGRYMMIQEPGTFYMTVQAPGYENMRVPITVSEGGTSVVNVSLTPIRTPVPDIPVTPVSTLAPNFKAEPASGYAPLSVKFTDLSHVSGGAIAAYEWDFGDGTSKSTEQHPVHIFEKPGKYTVTLKITASDGNSAIERKSDIAEVLQAVLLKAEFDFNPKSGQAPLTVTFTDTSAGDISGRQWYIGSEPVSTEKTFTHAFEQSGKYAIKLTISDSGAESSAEKEIEVSPIPVVQPGVIRGRITDAQTGQAIRGARITTSRNQSTVSRDDGTYEIFQEPGWFALDIVTVGYSAQHLPKIPLSEGETRLVNVALKPLVPKPILKSPDSGSETAMTPTLSTEDFPAAEDYTHASTQWQIAEDAEFSRLILDIRTSEYLTELYVPPLILQSAGTYLWRARFCDSSGIASLWSESRIFLTPVSTGNAVGKESVRTLQGNALITLESSSVSASQAFLPEEIPDKREKPSDMPIGMIAMKLNAAQPGDTATVRLLLSKNPPADSEWYVYDLTNGWMKAASGSDKSELGIKDGDIGDADGIANGIVVILTGLAAASSDKVLPEIQPPSEDVGGCFIRTLFP